MGSVRALKGINVFQRFFSGKITGRQADLMARSLPKKKPLPGVKDIILVASGKGGVGKSTTSVNLAVSLAQNGQRVGLLDADLFGPSIPLMMNLQETPLVDDDNRIIPPVNYNVKCLSLGLLTEMKPAIWRGPLVMSATERLLKGTVWEPLDVLVVDTPPGTGDIHLSLMQNVPISGVLLVSTPQLAALRVTQRGAEMFRILNVPILGIVENMSSVKCKNCGEEISIFGQETDKVAEEMGVEILERIQIDPNVMTGSDTGIPVTIEDPESDYAKCFGRLAKRLLKKLEK
ncbi:iron-sulfur protein NUBPL [Phlebotomus papatasi]|uniref:iron-sulfur protein NUBPL n=1 Tax=Phlebotomus papatasi TaxID=29031 RepID=UPI0024842608|nr:iron-sulfur protein NUBPL [Phlebotomus papatasi]